MGRSHAAVGVAAAVWTTPAAAVVAVPAAVWVAAVTAGSVLPDVDHPAASVTRMWGPLSRVPWKAVAPLLDGHRGTTHRIAGVVLVVVVVAVSTVVPVVAGIGYAVVAGAALVALAGVARVRVPWPLNTAVSVMVGVAAVAYGWPLWAVAAPTVVGGVAHVVCDRVPTKSFAEAAAVVVSYAAVAAWATAPIWKGLAL